MSLLILLCTVINETLLRERIPSLCPGCEIRIAVCIEMAANERNRVLLLLFRFSNRSDRGGTSMCVDGGKFHLLAYVVGGGMIRWIATEFRFTVSLVDPDIIDTHVCWKL